MNPLYNISQINKDYRLDDESRMLINAILASDYAFVDCAKVAEDDLGFGQTRTKNALCRLKRHGYLSRGKYFLNESLCGPLRKELAEDVLNNAITITKELSPSAVSSTPRYHMDMESHSQIENSNGVYFLINDLDIVYIGQSSNVRSRITTHVREDIKVFNKVAYASTNVRDQQDIEMRYINLFRPVYNIVGVE